MSPPITRAQIDRNNLLRLHILRPLSHCCIAWADPTRRLAFAYLTNSLMPGKEVVEHLAAVADDILSAYAVN
jgi:hypothetical protein